MTGREPEHERPGDDQRAAADRYRVLIDALTQPAFDRLVGLAVRALRVRTSVLALPTLDDPSTFTLAAVHGPRPDEGRLTPLLLATAGSREVHVSTTTDQSYAGISSWVDGRPLVISVLDEPGRRFSEDDRELLRALADSVVETLTLRLAVERTAQVEERVRQQASLLDETRDAMILRDLDGRVIYWNRGAEILYGWTAAEAMGRSLLDLIYGGRVEEFNEVAEGLLRDGLWTGRRHQVTRTGRQLLVDIRVTLVRSEDGTPVSAFSINTDVTERVELEERLAQAQKLESVGQLTGGVAHDFNNLLTVIIGTSDLALRDLPEESDLHELLTVIRTTGERAALLTSRLLAFGRRQSLRPEVVDAQVAVDALRGLIRSTIPENIDVSLVHHLPLWATYIDPGQFESALMNLCINARDAMPDGGRLTIECSNIEVEGPPQFAHPDIRAGKYVRVAVSDTGHGMQPDVLEHAFDPYFTTKPVGKGSGLGLSMVYGFIKQSGGHVDISSALGLGSTVRMYLPMAEPGQVAGSERQARE